MSVRHGRILASAFRPHPLLAHPHVQTIAPAKFRPLPALALRMERLETPDGDFVDLGWAGAEAPQAPVVVLVHGLGGGLESKYLRGFASRMAAAGWRVCLLLLRGASAEPNRLMRAYNQGDTQDLRLLWRRLRERHPEAFLASVGWSLGGNVTLKALGEEGDAAPVDVACALSVPFSLRECALHLRQGFARVYQTTLLDSLKDMVRRKHRRTPIGGPADLARALSARDFFEFDDAFTAPLNGYRDAEDYYARAACAAYLPHIRRPTRILHALDDPFMVPGIVPTAAQLAPCVTLELAEHGGHVGFISAGPGGWPQAWSERHLTQHLVDEQARLRPDHPASLAPGMPQPPLPAR